MAFKLSALFKKSKPESEPVNEIPPAEPMVQETTVEPEVERTPTKTTIDKSARSGRVPTSAQKRSAPKEGASKKDAAPRKTSAEKKKSAGTSQPAKASSTKAPKTEQSVKKTAVKGAAPKKSAAKKAEPANKEDQTSGAGTMPPELKGFEKLLKEFAGRSRMDYDAKNANTVFTEFMAKVFRDRGYKMVLIRDPDEGLISMLDRDKGEDDNSVKNKIIIRCAFMKKGSVEAAVVIDAQDDGAFYHADETWCMTATDFTDEAVRKSKKADAKVKLFDGKKLYKEFLNRYL